MPAVTEPVWFLPLAVAWDTFLGEPPARLHPVVWIGTAARWLERGAPRQGRGEQLAYGVALAFGPPLVYGLLVRQGWQRLCGQMWLAAVVGVPLLKSTFALRELRLAARQVQLALHRNDLPAARAGLAALVSRDPKGLDEALIAAAVIESLAENLSDAVVAPLCAWVCFGLPGAVVYRTVNTHDALFGYHGEYEWLGKAAARLDDLLNLVPARLTAGLLVAAAAVGGADPIRAGRTAWREAGQTDSPNAGWPMAAMAGALGVELTKVGQYRLGSGGAAPTAVTIKQADRLVLLAASGAITLAILGRWLWQRKG